MSAGRGRGDGKRPAHLAFLDGPDKRREPEPAAKSDRATFLRDEHGELVVIKPGEELPQEEKTAEDEQYEAYLQGRASGAIRAINGYSDGVDRAALADSASARDAEQQSERHHKPASAYNRAAKFKKRSESSSAGASEETVRSAAASMDEAMKRAREASDSEDEDVLSLGAAALADKAMGVYNEPVSSMLQRDVHGNDLRLPALERKLRRFSECFSEEASVRTVDGRPVLPDFEALKKRYGTVFRESGVGLRGGWRRRYCWQAPGGGLPSYSLHFEAHESLVTPRPGLALDGSMGVTAPRSQELVVLYAAEGGEISGMWIAPDADKLGAAERSVIDASPLYGKFAALVERLSDGASLELSYSEA